MALIRWEPVPVHRLFNSFFDTPTAAPAGTLRRWTPAIDVVETESEYVLRADLPGLTEQDVNVELENDVLTVSGERKSEQEERKAGYYRIERSSGSFRRALRLPEGVDPEAIKASFEHGVLEVRIPKPEQRKPRKVAISVGGGSESAPAIEGAESTEAAPQAA
jgi:HSP20 family protein